MLLKNVKCDGEQDNQDNNDKTLPVTHRARYQCGDEKNGNQRLRDTSAKLDDETSPDVQHGEIGTIANKSPFRFRAGQPLFLGRETTQKGVIAFLPERLVEYWKRDVAIARASEYLLCAIVIVLSPQAGSDQRAPNVIAELFRPSGHHTSLISGARTQFAIERVQNYPAPCLM